MSITFVSFNINGIRAHMHQLDAIINNINPDVISLQETKIHNDIFPIKKINNYGYNVCFYGKKCYQGVAILSKKNIFNIHYGFYGEKYGIDYRLITANIMICKKILTIINIYAPQGESRKHFKKYTCKKKFFYNLFYHVKITLKRNPLLLVMGDINISHTNLDIGIGYYEYKKWLISEKCSFLPEERKWLNRLFSLGIEDSFRKINPNINNKFSWFDYRNNSFYHNKGLRIDLLLLSQYLSKKILEVDINYDIRSMEKPSDHAPVYVKINI